MNYEMPIIAPWWCHCTYFHHGAKVVLEFCYPILARCVGLHVGGGLLRSVYLWSNSISICPMAIFNFMFANCLLY